MLRTFVTRPVTTTVFILFFVILGIVSYSDLNVRENPKVTYPIVSIGIVYPGATPEEVESQVLKKVEDAVTEVSEIKKITSEAYDSYGITIIEFILEADANIKSIEVKDKVEAIIEDLPSNIQQPIISKVDPLAKPVVDLVYYGEGKSLTELYEYADKKLKSKFTTIEGVAKVDLEGGRQRQVNILLDPILMKEYFVTIDQVIQIITAHNLNVPSGSVDMSSNSFGVRFIGEFQKVEDIGNIKFSTPEGKEISLNNIAIIEDGYKKIESISRFNSKEVIKLSIINTDEGNAIKIAQKVQQLLPAINEQLPEGTKVELSSDYTKVIVEENKDTMQGIGIGIVLTVIILLLFTGSIKSTIISAVVIPTSIISTFFLVGASGFTINIMSLLAIATALGTLVANAIVILESVIKHIDQGDDPITAAVDGTKAVQVPILASIGTNLVVFTPIAFMDGIVGKFMLEFGMTVIFVTIFSLIASFTLTPMLCGLLLKQKKNEEQARSFLEQKADIFVKFSLKEYKVIFDKIFKYPKLTIIFSLLLFVVSTFLAPFLGNEFTPKYDKNQIVIKLTLPENTLIDETVAVVEQIETLGNQLEYKTNITSQIGINGVSNAEVVIDLTDKRTRDVSDVDMIQQLIPKLSQIPDTEIMLYRGRPDGGSGANDVAINLTGNDFEEVLKNAKKVQSVLKETGSFQNVIVSYKKPGYELRFKPDAQKMSEYNAMNATVGTVLRSSIYGDDTNVYKENGEEYKINIKLRDQYINFPTDIEDISVMTRKGIVPVKSLGNTSIDSASSPLTRREKERVITVSGNLVKGTAGQVQLKVKEQLDKIEFKKGGRYYFTGQDETKTESEQALGQAFLLAAILTFLILAAILNSWIHPITIGSSILTSMSGVIVAMFVFDQSINIAALLAVVMLVGLVVNNSIILIDETNVFLNKGLSIKDSLWNALESRFKMILMTSLAIIFATAPQLFAAMEFKASMGAVIIGGMAASIFYTFVFTPIAFWYVERMRNYFSKK